MHTSSPMNELQAAGERTPPETATSVRTIPIADDLITVLDHRVAASIQGGIFETARGAPYRIASADGELRKTVTRLRECVTFHSFRHLYASRLISAGVSVKQVQRDLGHTTVSTTLDTYVPFFPGLNNQPAAEIARMMKFMRATCGRLSAGV